MLPLLLASTVTCAPPAAPYANITKMLKEGYAETVFFRGLTKKGELLTLFFNAQLYSWSAVVTSTDGCSTIVSSGKNGVPTPSFIPGEDI